MSHRMRNIKPSIYLGDVIRGDGGRRGQGGIIEHPQCCRRLANARGFTYHYSLRAIPAEATEDDDTKWRIYEVL